MSDLFQNLTIYTISLLQNLWSEPYWVGYAVERVLEEHAALLLVACIPGLNRPEEDGVLFLKERLQEPRAGFY